MAKLLLGSRKAIVYAAYQWQGRDAAIKIARRVGIQEKTARTWTSNWKNAPKDQIIHRPVRLRKPATKRKSAK